MVDFGKPLFADVFERGWGCDAEAYEKNIGLRIGKRSQTIIIFLSRGIE
jgi:hypothetical protein